MSQIILSRALKPTKLCRVFWSTQFAGTASLKTSACLASAPNPTAKPFAQSQVTKDFFERHAARSSPMSPYVMYKPQLTSVLSITHRITGLGLGVLLYGIGLSELANPSLNWEQILAAIEANVPASLLLAVKLASGTLLFTFNIFLGFSFLFF